MVLTRLPSPHIFAPEQHPAADADRARAKSCSLPTFDCARADAPESGQFRPGQAGRQIRIAGVNFCGHAASPQMKPTLWRSGASTSDIRAK